MAKDICWGLLTLLHPQPNLYNIASDMGANLGMPHQLRAVYIARSTHPLLSHTTHLPIPHARRSIFAITFISLILWWSISRVAAVDALPEIQQMAFLLSAVPTSVVEICDRKLRKKPSHPHAKEFKGTIANLKGIVPDPALKQL